MPTIIAKSAASAPTNIAIPQHGRRRAAADRAAASLAVLMPPAAPASASRRASTRREPEHDRDRVLLDREHREHPATTQSRARSATAMHAASRTTSSRYAVDRRRHAPARARRRARRRRPPSPRSAMRSPSSQFGYALVTLGMTAKLNSGGGEGMVHSSVGPCHGSAPPARRAGRRRRGCRGAAGSPRG